MDNYLNAFYGATNALCNTMTSVMYANEIEGVNATSENNKLLGPDGYKYHLSNGQTVTLPSYALKAEGFDSANSTMYGIGKNGERVSWPMSFSLMIAAVDHKMGTPILVSSIKKDFEALFKQGAFESSSYYSFVTQKDMPAQTLSNVTISQLVTYEQVRAKAGASANSMQAWGAIVQAANTDFSNIKNQAQAGTTQISGWVQTDGDELAAAANMLSSILQSLASPVTVS